MTVSDAPVAMYTNRYLTMGRFADSYQCQIVGMRGKHTRSFPSEAEWRVEVSRERGYYVCDYHVGAASLTLLGNRPSGFIEYLRLPRTVHSCTVHGDYVGAILRGGTYTPCPTCVNEGKA